MMWGCFWYGRVGSVVTVDGNLMADQYVDILSGHSLPFYNNLNDKYGVCFILQEDNAKVHALKKSKNGKKIPVFASFLGLQVAQIWALSRTCGIFKMRNVRKEHTCGQALQS